MYTDDEKRIYRPSLRGRELGGFDPLSLRRKMLIASDGQFNDLCKQYEGEDELQSAIAEGELVKAARTAFGVADAATDPNGVTDEEVLELTYDWMDWMGKPKGGESMPPSSSPSPDACRE